MTRAKPTYEQLQADNKKLKEGWRWQCKASESLKSLLDEYGKELDDNRRKIVELTNKLNAAKVDRDAFVRSAAAAHAYMEVIREMTRTIAESNLGR